VYDLKSAVNKAKAYALNLTEYETKVREATNDDAWGASSTLMQDIAQGCVLILPSPPSCPTDPSVLQQHLQLVRRLSFPPLPAFPPFSTPTCRVQSVYCTHWETGCRCERHPGDGHRDVQRWRARFE
jgi:hypothetical protein